VADFRVEWMEYAQTFNYIEGMPVAPVPMRMKTHLEGEENEEKPGPFTKK
jgi:hypothetical protein